MYFQHPHPLRLQSPQPALLPKDTVYYPVSVKKQLPMNILALLALLSGLACASPLNDALPTPGPTPTYVPPTRKHLLVGACLF